MSRRGPRIELRGLRRFVAEVEGRFISPHLGTPSLLPPSRAEELDAAAFVVLVHGAMENFIEGVGLWLVDRVERSWTFKKRATRATASLLLYQNPPADDSRISRSVYDNIRLSVSAAKGEVAKTVAGNNGIALQHLRTLFRPLGVDVPENPMLVASLDKLVSMRHRWAHQYRFGAAVPRTASDAKVVADDCLKIAETIAEAARKARI